MPAFDDFSVLYDHMFPWEKRWRVEGPFFSGLFEDRRVRSVLDCACGPGRHVIQFAKAGLMAHGLDLSPDMIRQAQANARQEGVKPRFQIGSFTNLAELYDPPEQFDAVVCLGNSLTLAPSDEGVAVALLQMQAVLRPGGVCVLHLFNWDKLALEGLRIMPAVQAVVDGREAAILRIFHHCREVVHLHLVVMTGKGKELETVTRTAEQRPVGPVQLRQLLIDAGFADPVYYANYQSQPFDPATSGQLVAVAEKPAESGKTPL